MRAESLRGRVPAFGRRHVDWQRLAPKASTVGIFVLVMAFAAAVRFYRLGAVPSNLTADETDIFRDAYFVLEGRGPGIFSQGQSSTVGPFGTYLFAWTLRAFGDSIVGLRMYSVLFSLAVLAVFFVIARFRFSLYTTFVATMLFATSLPSLHFSRTAWTNMNAALIAIAICCALLIACESQHFWLFGVAGLATGLAVWAYPAARLMPLVVVLFVPFALFIYRGQRKRIFIGFLVAGVVSLIVAAPVLWELRTNTPFEKQYTERTRRVSIFDGVSLSDGLHKVPANAVRTVRGYVLLSNDDNNFRRSAEAVRYAPRDEALFDPLTRVLFWTGLIAGIIFWRKAILWFLIFGGSLVSQVFSMGTPSAARGVVILPILFLFVGLGLEQVVRSVERHVRPQQLKMALGGLGVLFVIGIALFNTQRYFDWMGSSYAFAERGPYVTHDEFSEWSTLQHDAIASGHGSFNTGTWRGARDFDDCFSGFARGDVCASRTVQADPPPLGAAMNLADVDPNYVHMALTDIGQDGYRNLQGGRSDPLAQALKGKPIDDAWASVYEAPEASIVVNVAQFHSAEDASTFLNVRMQTHGEHYVGGPKSQVLSGASIGDASIVERFDLSDQHWWEYYWRDGRYVVQTRVLYSYIGNTEPSGRNEPIAVLDAVTNQVARGMADVHGD